MAKKKPQREAPPQEDYYEDEGPAPKEEPKGGALITSRQSDNAITAAMSSAAQHEVQAAVLIAMKFPRDEDQALQDLLKTCTRPAFAEEACYEYPRGGQKIKGPSVVLAREAARCWKNIRYGFHIVADSEATLHIRGFAWDMQSNEKVELDDCFRKLIYRKQGGWIQPDERELRELVNRRGAIVERNSILKVVPNWLIEEARAACDKTASGKAATNLEEYRQKLVGFFMQFSVSVQRIERYLGHPFKESTADELSSLRKIAQAIFDGQAKWVDYEKQAAEARGEKVGTAGDSQGSASTPHDRAATIGDLMEPKGEREEHPEGTRGPKKEKKKPEPAKEPEGDEEESSGRMEEDEGEIHGQEEAPPEPEAPRRKAPPPEPKPEPVKELSPADKLAANFLGRIAEAGSQNEVQRVADEAEGEASLPDILFAKIANAARDRKAAIREGR